MPRQRKINDVQLAELLGKGKTHDQIAEVFGTSRVAVTRRVGWLKENKPLLLATSTVDEFREKESDVVAEARKFILDAVMERVKSVNGLNRESLPQLIKAFAILWDKDEKIQEKQNNITRVAHLHQLQLDDKTQKLLTDVIEHMTNKALAQSKEDIIEAEIAEVESGDSDDPESRLLTLDQGGMAE